jgi:DNA polymerase III sliding clamp (beta) subunit (PCNA family)
MATKKARPATKSAPPEKPTPATIPANIVEVAKFCDDESTRYALGGISVKVADGKYEVCATDTRRLVVVSGSCNGKPVGKTLFTAHANRRVQDATPYFEGIIGGKDLKKAVALSADKSKAIAFNQNGNSVCVAVDGARAIDMPLIEGRFPNYQDVLPKDEPATTMLLDPQLLAEAFALAKKFATKCHRGVFVDIWDRERAIRIRARREDGQEFVALVMPLTQEGR